MALVDPRQKMAEIEQAAAAKVERQMASVPEQYRDFITLLDQTKKSGSVSAKIQTAYMQVDGRVRMFVDEHRKADSKFTIAVQHYMEGDHPHTKVRVASEMLGAAEATAKIGFGGHGADSTNPIENAETSALGRALGFLGYGLLGGGIASAEEVERAISERENA